MLTSSQSLTSEPTEALFPDGFQFLFERETWRYKIAYGGRGSGKSWAYARALLILAMAGPLRVLCTRELQTSISESVHRLLSDQITALGFDAYFEVQQTVIYRHPYMGSDGVIVPRSEFIFYGIKNNPTKIKSAEGIDVCWVEEAEKVSATSWEILIPTIRKPNSEIWISFNPDEENDPTYQRFVLDPPPRSKVAFVNWHQNPWFPLDLRNEMEYLYRVDAIAAEHVWGGQCRKNSSSQIFRGKYSVQDFVPPNPAECDADHPMWSGPYYGADWGFSQDPTVLVKLWIDTKERRLMVEKEAWKVGLELDDTGAFFKEKIPECAAGLIRADCSRPETISFVARNGGLRIEAAEKWSGSVEDGIAFLKNFTQIVYHTRCIKGVEEARLYSYKVDRLTREVLKDIVDKHNHVFDAKRYALEPMVTRSGNLNLWARLGR